MKPKRVHLLLLFVFCLACVLPAIAEQKAVSGLSQLSDSFEALAEKVSPAVVEIFATGYGADSEKQGDASLLTNQRSSGSGVLLDAEGTIVTNAHVVQSAQRLRVLLSDRKTSGKSILKPKGKMVEAKLIGLDSETDLAVLKIQPGDYPFLELADSDHLKPGQIVLAFGSPFGLENSLTMGVVSAVARQLRPEDPMIYIQTDAPINPGNSGGPLVDTEGRVVGINTFIYTQSGGNEGIGFAAPSNIVRNVFFQLRKSGSIERGEIGITAQTITPSIAAGLALQQDWGVVVGDVTPNGPGDRAGIQIGDVLLTLDGKALENARQLDVNLYRRTVGDRVTIEGLRGTQSVSFEVSVAKRPEEPSRIALLATAAQNLVPRLGVYCLDLDDKIAAMIPTLRKQYGAVVVARAPDAPYSASVFTPGDVIHSVNGKLIKNLSELREGVDKLAKGEPLVLQIERAGKLQFVSYDLE